MDPIRAYATALGDLGFEREASPSLRWFARGPVRVTVSVDGEVTVFRFTDARRYVCAWSVATTTEVPVAVVLATVNAALAESRA